MAHQSAVAKNTETAWRMVLCTWQWTIMAWTIDGRTFFRASDIVSARGMAGSEVSINIEKSWPEVDVVKPTCVGECGNVKVPSTERVLVCGALKAELGTILQGCARGFIFHPDDQSISVYVYGIYCSAQMSP